MRACRRTLTTPSRPGRAESGAGSVLALAVVAGTLLVTALAIPGAGVLVTRQRASAAADAAALAAADVAAGAVPGYPCETARQVAGAHDTQLSGCLLDGLVVTVRVTASVAGMTVAAAATAGPPP